MAVARLVFLAWCLALSAICLAALAAPTFGTSSTPQHKKDSRVAQLRAALLDSPNYHLEALPDPPPDLGIHTACKKFGRGCPDTYISFLERLLASLSGEEAGVDVNGCNVTGQAAVRDEVRNATPRDPVEMSSRAATQTEPVVESHEQNISEISGHLDDAAVSFVSLPPRDLRLPLQLSWSYEKRRRLENLLNLISTREAGLRRDGVAPESLQRLYHVPSAEHIHLVEDLDGSMAMWLHVACAMGSLSLPAGWTEQLWEDVYSVWCRHVEQQRQHQQNSNWSTTDATSAIPSSLVAFPRRARYCTALHHATLYMELLVLADQFIATAWNWTLCIALPSAFVACILVWLCVGDPWTEAAEAFMTSFPSTAPAPAHQHNREMKGCGGREGIASGPTPHKCGLFSKIAASTLTPAAHHPTRRAETASSTPSMTLVAAAEEQHDAPSSPYDAAASLGDYQRQRQEQQQRQQVRRIAVLRCRFAESALHRSSTLFFLKLRLLLCLLVAGQLLWILWRVLTASYTATAETSRLVHFFLPSWLLTCLSVYIIVPLEVMVLGTALKGALHAHEELLSFQARCAAEQRALLNAAGWVDVCVPPPPPIE
ncbi:hypothetical protein JKF63_00551 [Porcisia hertigi]|uniref:Uncharacterized protein n=1 Tax=Porcisia hertigi TaxID=2761500 RepID=A0A836KX67_9TRYP|nr:hypothetical protein JKF63_00551 [Porcisia hertigi]